MRETLLKNETPQSSMLIELQTAVEQEITPTMCDALCVLGEGCAMMEKDFVPAPLEKEFMEAITDWELKLVAATLLVREAMQKPEDLPDALAELNERIQWSLPIYLKEALQIFGLGMKNVPTFAKCANGALCLAERR